MIASSFEDSSKNLPAEECQRIEETKDDRTFEFIEDLNIDDSSEALNDFAAAVEDKEFHNFRIVAEADSKVVTGNKVMIAARSKYWRQIFQIRSHIDAVTVEEVSYRQLDKCMKYMQTGRMEIESVEEAVVIHILAEEYVLKELSRDTLKYIYKNLNTENVWTILKTKKSMKQLLTACINFMAKHSCVIFEDTRLVRLNKEELIQLISSEPFELNPMNLLRALHRWLLVHRRVDPITVLRSVDFTNFNESHFDYIAKNVCELSETEFRGFIDKNNVKKRISRKEIESVLCSLIPRSFLISEKILELNFNRKTNSFTVPDNVDEIYYDKVAIIYNLLKREVVNCILFTLTAGEFAFYIEASVDGKSWTRIVDRSNDCVQGEQILYFQQIEVKSIKIIGVEYTNDNESYFMSWINYVSDSFNVELVQLCHIQVNEPIGMYRIPTMNVISEEESAVLFVSNKIDQNCNLLKEVSLQEKYKHSCRLMISETFEDNFIDIALSQPFLLSEITLLFGKNGAYSFNIYVWPTHQELFFDVPEATLRRRHPPQSMKWKLIAQYEDVSVKQTIQFEQQPVSVISIECRNVKNKSEGKVFELIDIFNPIH